MLLYFLIIL